MARRFKLPLLILVAAMVYLIGNDRVPLWDRDEPRNAQAARQMLISGDWVVPHFLDKVRTAKPPFTNWCQLTAMKLFGQNSFSARLPSAVAMTLTLIVLGVLLTRFVDSERAFWTVLILATSGIVIGWSARTSLTDAVLLLWITIAQACLFAVIRGNITWRIVITWAIAAGLATLTKGPVVLGVQAATILFLWLGRLARVLPKPWAKEARARHPSHAQIAIMIAVGIAIILALFGSWAILVEIRAPGFLLRTTSHEVFQRMFEPLEQHFGPPGYYLIAIWGIYFPWSVLLPLTFVVAWRHRDEPNIRFALAAIIGPWILMECVQTKLPHYVLPIFPPLAYLTADAVIRCLKGEHNDLTTRGTRNAIGGWALITAGLAIAIAAFGMRFKNAPVLILLLLLFCGIAYAAVVFWLFLRRRAEAGLLVMGAGMLLLMAILCGMYLPRAEYLQLSVRLADILRVHGATGDVQMVQYKEPSLAFYQGGSIREQPENNFLEALPLEQWPAWMVFRQDIWDRLPASVKERLEIVGSARGLDGPDSGRTWTVYVVRKRPPL